MSITPHADIAALFAGRAVRLDWRRPAAAPPLAAGAASSPSQARPSRARAPTNSAMRRGRWTSSFGRWARCWRAQRFWDGVRLDPTPADGHWLDGVSLVVHPALTQDAPRRLLEALAAGVPVIATPACGLDPEPLLTLVAPNDPEGLKTAIARALPVSA